MSATLKDLAPAEKQKVARLIRQVVEKEAQIRELKEKAAFSDGVSAGAGAAKADQLTEQNAHLARENTRFVRACVGSCSRDHLTVMQQSCCHVVGTHHAPFVNLRVPLVCCLLPLQPACQANPCL